LRNLLLVLAIVALGFFGLTKLNGPSRVLETQLEPQSEAVAASVKEPRGSIPTPAAAESPRFFCDGRTTCSQMTSCAEAEYFLAHCPNVQMDGNNDGEPCEQQWCN
jgi:hypothetical protein